MSILRCGREGEKEEIIMLEVRVLSYDKRLLPEFGRRI